MKYEYKEIDDCPVVVVDDLFDAKEQKEIWRTINSLSVEGLMEPRATGSAHEGGVPTKQNSGVFLSQIYNEEMQSLCPLNRAILPKMGKLGMESEPSAPSSDERIGFGKYHPALSQFHRCHQLSVLLSYYEDEDNYQPHFDHSAITSLCWFSRHENAFEGGDLIIGSQDSKKEKIEFKNNRIVIIPGWALHEVTPVTMNEGFEEEGDGRWCVSIFHS